MPITYTILDNLYEIGTCEGLPDSDHQGNYILFPPEMYQLVQVGNILVTPTGEHLELYFEDPVVKDNELITFKMYYR